MNGEAPHRRGSDSPAPAGPAAGAAAPPGVERYLVRYAPSGRVGWFGHVGPARCRRGAEVVVDTALGQWLGRVLRHERPDAPHPGRWEPSGELLRAATDADRRAAEAARRVADELLRLVFAGAVRLPAEGQLIDAEVSLCRRVGVCRWAGPERAELGPVAVRLAERAGLQRVQMLTTSGPASPGAAAAGTADREAGAGSAAAAEPWLELQQRLADPAARLGKEHRERLGLAGLYEQKLRAPRAATGDPEAPPGRSAPAAHAAPAAARAFMVRVRLAGGRLTAAQLAAAGRAAVAYGDGTLRLTSRQGLQLHGVAKAGLAELLDQLAAVLLSTGGTCGNAARNVTCCPLVAETPLARAAERLAADVSGRLTPRRPLVELLFREHADEARWRDALGAESEPVYGTRYLPHKWKVAVATDGDNCVDALVNDVAVVVRSRGAAGARSEDTAEPSGWATLCAGGSLAYRPGRVGSFPALAEPVADVPLAAAVEGVEAMIRLYRRLEPSGSRHERRWKYLVRRLGPAGVGEALREQDAAIDWRPATPLGRMPRRTHRGWMRQRDGRWALGIPVAGGRLRFSEGPIPWLRLLELLPGAVRLGVDHMLLLPNLTGGQRASVERLLGETLARDQPRRIACPAMPTCPLAVGPAETVLEETAEALARACAARGLAPLDLALSGCGNGCSRPLTGEVGILAERPDRYAVFAAGDGRQLARRLGAVARPADLETVLGPWLDRFAARPDPAVPWNAWVRAQPAFRRDLFGGG